MGAVVEPDASLRWNERGTGKKVTVCGGGERSTKQQVWTHVRAVDIGERTRRSDFLKFSRGDQTFGPNQ